MAVKKIRRPKKKEPYIPKSKRGEDFKVSPVSNLNRGKGRRSLDQRREDKRKSNQSTGAGSTSANTENTNTKKTKGAKAKPNVKQGEKFWEGSGQKFNYDGKFSRKLNKGVSRKIKDTNQIMKDVFYDHSLSKVDLEGSKWKKGANALKTANSSFLGNMKVKENRLNAGKGIVKSTAFSAAAHGGLAYLQGDDPWEAAKTGAIRGALVGGGYQYAKAATGAKSNLKGMKGIKDNGKQILTGGRDLFKAHSITGNTEMRKDVRNISPQLKRVLEQKERNEMTGGLFGLKTK